MSAELLLREFDRLSEAPDAIPRLRPFIVELAVRGNLTAGTSAADSADGETVAAGMRSLLDSRPKYRWQTAAAARPTKQVGRAIWCRVRLEDAGLFVNGIAFKPSDWSSTGRPIIRIQNLSGQSTNFNYAVGEYNDDNIARPGDLLVSWSATLDTFVWLGPEGIVNQHIFKVVPNASAVTPGFLYWLLKHEVKSLAAGQHAHGLAMMHINRRPFLSHEVWLPPLAEQHRIVAKVDELMALCDELESAQNRRESRRDALRTNSVHRLLAPPSSKSYPMPAASVLLGQLDRLVTKTADTADVHKTILALAVRGKLVPQDPNDEPADRVLSRLRVDATPSYRDPSIVEPFRLPPGWAWVHFRDLGQFGRGRSKHRPRNDRALFDGGTHPLIQTGDVARSGGFIRSAHAWYNEFGLAQSQSWPAGTLCITIAANIADSGILEFDACFPDSVVGLVVSDEFDDARYFDYFIHTAKADLLAFAPSTAQKNINMGILNEVLIPLPPPEEINRIVARVGELIAVCDSLGTSLEEVRRNQMLALESLLDKALWSSATGFPA